MMQLFQIFLTSCTGMSTMSIQHFRVTLLADIVFRGNV